MSSLNSIQEKLLERHIIDLEGEVKDVMVIYVREAIMRLIADGSPPITVCLTSSGGSVDIGLDIYDFLRLYKGKKTGIVAGYSQSMAAIILQACDVRQCMRHSSVLIHHVQRRKVSLDDLRSPGKIKKVRDDLEKSQEKLYAILEKRTGKSRKEITDVCAKDTDMTSEEALAFGLIDEII